MKTTTEQTKEPITNVSDGILSDEEAGRRVDMDFYPNNEAGAFDYMDEIGTSVQKVFSLIGRLLEMMVAILMK